MAAFEVSTEGLSLIRGWLRSPPAVRRAPKMSGPSLPVSAKAWDALTTLAPIRPTSFATADFMSV